MPTLTIPAGTLQYRVSGPTESPHPPVVFVHGFLVDSRLWGAVADRLAAAGPAVARWTAARAALTAAVDARVRAAGQPAGAGR